MQDAEHPYCSSCRHPIESTAAIEAHNAKVALSGERVYRIHPNATPITMSAQPVALAKDSY